VDSGASQAESDLDPRGGGLDIVALRFFVYATGVAVDLGSRERGGSMRICCLRRLSAHTCVNLSTTTIGSADGVVTASSIEGCPGASSKGRFSLRLVAAPVRGLGEKQFPGLDDARFNGDGEQAGVLTGDEAIA
jgi:hypothetical protein